MREIVYHGTNNVFDKFDLDYCGSIDDHASNSKLGLFFGSASEKNIDDIPEFLSSFGGYIIKAELDLSNIYIMKIDDFSSLHKESENQYNIYGKKNFSFWLKKRKEFLDQGFQVIALKENNKVPGRKDNISMYIVLDTNVILNHEYIKSPRFKI